MSKSLLKTMIELLDIVGSSRNQHQQQLSSCQCRRQNLIKLFIDPLSEAKVAIEEEKKLILRCLPTLFVLSSSPSHSLIPANSVEIKPNNPSIIFYIHSCF